MLIFNNNSFPKKYLTKKRCQKWPAHGGDLAGSPQGLYAGSGVRDSPDGEGWVHHTGARGHTRAACRSPWVTFTCPRSRTPGLNEPSAPPHLILQDFQIPQCRSINSHKLCFTWELLKVPGGKKNEWGVNMWGNYRTHLGTRNSPAKW